MNQERMMDCLLRLCHVGSISGSVEEKKMSALLKELLFEIPYFQNHPELVYEYDIDDDETRCSYVFALMKATKKVKRTIVLLSHFDVVGIDEYGSGMKYAFDPVAYTNYLKEGHLILDEESQIDLDSGDYLFGRGVCDMKWGIASDIELLHVYDQEKRDANLLFVSVPDEERNSEGMLDAVKRLYALAKTEDLEYEFCVVGEPDISPDKCEDGHRMFIGAAGKLMPMFYCVGKETHVGDPYFGLNPDLLNSAIVMDLENNPDWIDEANGYFTPAPTCLKASDLKNAYSVQTPYDAYSYFNLMTLSFTPQDILEKMRFTALHAFESVLELRNKRHQKVCERLGMNVPCSKITPLVMTYEELYASCKEVHGEKFVSHMKHYIESLEEVDIRYMTLQIIQETHRYAPNREPKIILAFAPPYYPHSGFLEKDDLMRKACELIIEDGKEVKENYIVNECFNGLTDMCYLGLRDKVDIDGITRNFPLWGKHYEVPLDMMKELNIPFINFGPNGKDPHKFSERIDLNYSMQTAPILLKKLVDHMMKL